MNKKNTSLNNKLIKIFIISIIVYLSIYIFVNVYADTLKNNIERIHIIETEANNFSNNILTGDNNLPSIFHSGFDDDNHFTVRLQKNLDICFSHAIISMTESSIHKQLKEEVFLSRRHLDYISSNSDESSPYAFGRNIGSNSLAYNSLYYGLNGSGYVDEKKFKEDYLVNKLPYSEMKKDTLPFLLTDFIQFKTIEKKDMSQMTENEKTAYLNEMTNARNNIKKHILEKGIVLAQIHVDDVTPYKYGLFYGISPIHKDTMHINHSICIVGWDDTIDPKLFEDDFTNYPKQKGAWIVYDSRGPTARGLPESEPKRYYISYSDAFIEKQIFGINNIEKLDKKIKIYQHEKWGNNVTANLTEHSYEILNIFEKSTDNEEEIYGIGFNS